ncbi:MAG: cell wall hydrolase [Oscillospiraceae bacterium]
MQKRYTSLALSLVLCFGVATQAVASDGKQGTLPAGYGTEWNLPATDSPETTRLSNFRVNGVETLEDVRMKDCGGTLYASMRDVANAMRPGIYVEWNGTRVLVWAKDLSITAVPGERYIIANERYLYVPEGVMVEDGAVMVPVRTLVKAFNGALTWDAATGVSVTGGSGAIAPGNAFYNAEDLYWLSHIIYAESGNQPLEGQIAVGNVILNRKASSQCPNTVKGVVFQKNQFTPVKNGSINLKPSAKSVIAAKLVLDGAEVLDGNAMFFSRADMGSWMARNRPHIATIGAHAFYG